MGKISEREIAQTSPARAGALALSLDKERDLKESTQVEQRLLAWPLVYIQG
jgi:hypothetical protein